MQEYQTLLKKTEEKIRRSRDELVAQRTINEQVIRKFAENVKLISPELISHINIPEVITPESILPSMYKEPFDEEAYRRERDAYNLMMLEFSKVQEAKIKEAKALMKEYLEEGN